MKTTLNKAHFPKASKKEIQEIQELQKALEATTLKLKKSKSKKDQLIAKFLESNYINPQTGLITTKSK
jgi:hypothetical protein